MEFTAPTEEAVQGFATRMRAAGIFTTIRKEMGQDVSGACGQLALTVRKRAAEKEEAIADSTAAADIEDIAATMGGSASTAAGPVRRTTQPKTKASTNDAASLPQEAAQNESKTRTRRDLVVYALLGLIMMLVALAVVR